jgi:hypothetical protein
LKRISLFFFIIIIIMILGYYWLLSFELRGWWKTEIYKGLQDIHEFTISIYK